MDTTYGRCREYEYPWTSKTCPLMCWLPPQNAPGHAALRISSHNPTGKMDQSQLPRTFIINVTALHKEARKEYTYPRRICQGIHPQLHFRFYFTPLCKEMSNALRTPIKKVLRSHPIFRGDHCGLAYTFGCRKAPVHNIWHKSLESMWYQLHPNSPKGQPASTSASEYQAMASVYLLWLIASLPNPSELSRDYQFTPGQFRTNPYHWAN